MAYDIYQSVFLMSMASNGACGVADTNTNLFARLQVYLEGGTFTNLKQQTITYDGFFPMRNSDLIGHDWQVIWGPCVYSRDPSAAGNATNAMYAAWSQSQNTIVVAIAATDPDSIQDWIGEDANVKPANAVPWPLQLPYPSQNPPPPPPQGSCYISAGTAQGINDLINNMADPESGNIQTFLSSPITVINQVTNTKQTIAKSDTTLIFTGHSLGGALSPTLAMYLYDDPAQSGWASIYVLPTAGASPGSPALASLFASTYPQTPPAPKSGTSLSPVYGCWNADHTSTRDMVPHAWDRLPAIVSSAVEGGIESIFGVMSIFYGDVMSVLLQGAEAMSGGSQWYQHLPLLEFIPSWQTFEWTDAKGNPLYPPAQTNLTVYTSTDPLNSNADFLAMVRPTHIYQYTMYFGVIPIEPMADFNPDSVARFA